MSERLKVKSEKSGKILLIALFVLLGLSIYAGQASAELTAIANHDRIKIDFFYHGSNVSVRGISDPGTDLIIKISSPDGHQELRQQGKVGGLLWMNVGTLKFEKVPSLYFLASSKKIDEILSKEAMAKDVLGYEAVEEPC